MAEEPLKKQLSHAAQLYLNPVLKRQGSVLPNLSREVAFSNGLEGEEKCYEESQFDHRFGLNWPYFIVAGRLRSRSRCYRYLAKSGHNCLRYVLW